ncbi:hypothetical protein TNCV_3025751 [Trichonephila clavipes]|nr:hypothetical protein TNCV_3025751 [Trichonephila clavipes]
MLDLVKKPMQQTVEANDWARKRMIWILLSDFDLLDFPRLTWKDLRYSTLGIYKSLSKADHTLTNTLIKRVCTLFTQVFRSTETRINVEEKGKRIEATFSFVISSFTLHFIEITNMLMIIYLWGVPINWLDTLRQSNRLESLAKGPESPFHKSSKAASDINAVTADILNCNKRIHHVAADALSAEPPRNPAWCAGEERTAGPALAVLPPRNKMKNTALSPKQKIMIYKDKLFA